MTIIEKTISITESDFEDCTWRGPRIYFLASLSDMALGSALFTTRYNTLRLARREPERSGGFYGVHESEGFIFATCLFIYFFRFCDL